MRENSEIFFLNPTAFWKFCSDPTLVPTTGISANGDAAQGLRKHGFSQGLVCELEDNWPYAIACVIGTDHMPTIELSSCTTYW